MANHVINDDTEVLQDADGFVTGFVCPLCGQTFGGPGDVIRYRRRATPEEIRLYGATVMDWCEVKPSDCPGSKV